MKHADYIGQVVSEIFSWEIVTVLFVKIDRIDNSFIRTGDGSGRIWTQPLNLIEINDINSIQESVSFLQLENHWLGEKTRLKDNRERMFNGKSD